MEQEICREKIAGIEFRMLSPEMIKKMAVVKITSSELYDADGYPTEGGLMDPRMGSIDPALRCRTCGGSINDCPGHFGYIELAYPVIHVEYVPLIYNFLRCTCRKCGRILMSDEECEKWKAKILKAESKIRRKYIVGQIINKLKNVKKCPHCHTIQEKIKLEKPSTFYEGNKQLTPIDVRERLEKVPDQDCILLGLDPNVGRPEWAVLTLLPIPPPSMRPTITLETGQRSEDDLTHKLSDIIRNNERLYENLNAGAPEVIIEDLWELLQYHVTTYFNNTIAQIPVARHRSGRPLKTLAQRIRGKDGIFRKHLAGKRVNFCARTVISPDPFIGIDEVGVPLEIAMELTVPERVNELNIEQMKKYIENAENYPCALYVVTPDNKRKRVTKETKELILKELAPGYIVERQLQDGDIVLFNRQPSLHKISIIAHRVKVLPYRSFRINVCATIPYNADFDGDEMNLHVPQTEEARAEAEILMSVRQHILTPRYGLPIIGCIQDYVLGCYLLTQPDTLVEEDEAQKILYFMGIYDMPEPDVKKDGKRYYSGKLLFSCSLPKVNYEDKNLSCRKCEKCKLEKCEYGAYVKIRNGKLISGCIDAKLIAPEKGFLIQKIVNDLGMKEAYDFIQKVSMLGILFLQYHGSSIYISDTDLPPEAIKEIKEEIRRGVEKVDRLIEIYRKGELEAYPGKTLEETFELMAMMELNRTRNKVAQIVEKYISSPNIPTLQMARSGARGSLSNLASMAACVGQQNLRGLRIRRGYKERTLPHFERGDLSAAARGFITHGYKAGLTPIEFFFHSIVGRDSVMDTSLRTPRSGYLQRRLVNALQDLKVSYDLSVRDSENKIVQFIYGEDGLDPTFHKIVEGVINELRAST
ncbi:MAG: DNA-directed RNA polymerase subunit A' [Candidatus Nanoarchaeia archaeon]|nr:DNA-directed RNA polymerase subunit A' [Candidatus Haiyanarchaeum thermophilum]MCW1303079.1 DNA-directed RNA polymerase subunit A' [Candidatus Haiyanarchaeum thermophilum]MCW1303744.1 DNA-directed RNA polymerase subunit A' [Candidatus Haiyanarchaeum thermophilum]MCW1306811.1 DNA-directed RNA polymerase subunit A' [Candidatus Haiyanarchaeum thermophilum]MCW1307053.1 DNA-directed RNA polymerase subunit A' [Candidatus Haiyanarchaeum thermophilum]